MSGLEMLERPLGRVMFGNAGAVPGKPGIMTGVVEMIVDMKVLLPVVIVVRLPIDVDGKLGSTVGVCADGVSPENSDIVLGKPPVPLCIDVGLAGGEVKEDGGLGYKIVKKNPQSK
ncbi:hypothetical protein MMC07_006957 [Pseudocyphellaria aurata]|nr:hypothetical protein [Pseudocyphellaria aurata]